MRSAQSSAGDGPLAIMIAIALPRASNSHQAGCSSWCAPGRPITRSMQHDAPIRTRIDVVLERFATELFQWRGGEVGMLIAEVVHNWDARTLSDRLELVLGSDLQHIRINGTIVGAFVGCVIHLLSVAAA